VSVTRGHVAGSMRRTIEGLCREVEQARSDRDEAITQAVSIGRELKKLEARVEAVLALHVAAGIPEPFVPGPRYCRGCGCAWPCPTRRALEGEK
jgi:hypothetical protein